MKKLIQFKVLLNVALLFLIQYSNAQTTFSKIFFDSGRNYSYSFVELEDSGFVFIGDGYYFPQQGYWSIAARTDKYGDTLWLRRYSFGGLFDIVNIDNQHFLTCGTIDSSRLSIQVMKIDLNGDTSAFHDYGYPTSPQAYSTGLQRTLDNGYILRNYPSNDYEILKLDSAFNEEWHQNVFNMPYGCSKIVPDPLGGYVAIGDGFSPLYYHVTRFNNNGGLVWERSYGNPPVWDTDPHGTMDIVFMPDSNFLISTTGFDWQLMKINRITGDTMWTKNFYSNPITSYYIFDELDFGPDNSYIIANNSSSKKLILINEIGDTIWTKPYPIQNFEIRDLKRTSDGGYAMCGYVHAPLSDTTSIGFAKVDSLGNGVFTSIFNPQYNFAAFSFYPNPAREQIFINAGSLATEKNVVFTLSDMQGRTVLQQPYGNNGAIDISVIPAGLYIATLRGKEKELRGKVMVER